MLEDLIYHILAYHQHSLETKDERDGFVEYMAEAFNRYVTVKRRIDYEQEKAIEKFRRMANRKTEEVQEKEEIDDD